MLFSQREPHQDGTTVPKLIGCSTHRGSESRCGLNVGLGRSGGGGCR